MKHIWQRLSVLTKDINKGIIIGSILLFVFLSLFVSNYLNPYNLEVVSMNFIQEGIMALGMTIVIISGGIDLSVGSVMGFSAIVITLLLKAGIGIPLAVILTLVISGSIGFLNGFLINRLKAHPFIVTLSTMTIFRGGTYVLTEGGTIGGVPLDFSFLGQGSFLGLRFPIFLFLVLAVVIGFLLQKHKFLNRTYLIGSNSRAARLAGINVEKMKASIYILSSSLAGVAGMITASQYLSANAGFGLTAELKVITAVIIGGASLSGGKGCIGGTFWGVVFIALINSIFIQMGLPTFWEKIVYGGMLVIAVLIEKYTQSKRTSVKTRWEDFLLGGGDN